MQGLGAIMAGGAGDLAASMGLYGQGNHPKVRGAAERIVQAAKQRGLKVGIYLADVAATGYWRDIGVDFYAFSIDHKVLAQAYTSAHASMVGLIEK